VGEVNLFLLDKGILKLACAESLLLRMSPHVLANTTNDENVVQASLPASFGGKMPPLPSIFKGVTMF